MNEARASLPQGVATPNEQRTRQRTKIGSADQLESKSQTCRLFEAAKTIPPDAAFVSLCLKGKAMPVKSADDVLLWICKKMLLLKTTLFRCVIRSKKVKWLRPFPHGMSHPYRIAFDCYVDFDGTGMTSLLRASLIMNWMSWPVNDVSVTYTTPIPLPGAVVAKMLVKQAMGKSPMPAPVTATEKPIEPPGVTPTESTEGGHAGRVTLPTGSGDIEADLSGHAGRVTLPHEDAHVEASPKPAESGHAGRASRSDLNGRGERPARPPERAHAKENSENAPAAKAIPSTANGVIGIYSIEDLIDPKSLDPRKLYGKRVMRLTVEGCDYDVLSWRKCFNVFVKHCFDNHLRELTKLNWSSNWDKNAWPLVRRIYPGPTRYEVVETDKKDAVALVTAMGMIRRGCQIRPDDIRIVCEMKREKPATTKPVESGHAGTRGPTVGRDMIGACSGGHAGTRDGGTTEAFAADLAANCPNGFDFKETSRRLVEKRVGKRMSDAIAKALQSRMFERGDGLWLFPQAVMDDDARERMTARAKELLASEGAFALDALRDEFTDAIRNVPSGADFKRFFNAAVAKAVDGRVRGHEGWRVCFRADTDEAAGWAAIAERVRGILEEAGDALSVADVLAQLPHLDREVVLRVCKESIADAVVFVAEEIEYVKLLAAFYLPEDFGETVSAFVKEAEAQGGAVTETTLAAAFDARYGEGFRVNFGLEDEEAFRQVVAKSFAGEEHIWKGDVFASTNRRVFRNVADEFVNVRHGVFHEDEFFKYALEKRGLGNHTSLICQYLRTRCVRLNKTMWIGLSDFQNRKVLDDVGLDAVRQFLSGQLGTSSILHIGLLPEMAFDSLEPMIIDGSEYHWNAYNVTSVARHLIRDLNLVNDEPSPYYVTAMLLPSGVTLANEDVVDHVFKVCKESGAVPQSADEAFEYLKGRQVRMMKTAKLMEKIKAFWSF